MVAVRRSRPAPRRAYVLETLIKANGWTLGCELGVFRGDTFKYLVQNCPDLVLIGIDTWEHPEAEATDPGFRSYSEHDLEGYLAHLNKWAVNYVQRARLVRGDTVRVLDALQDHEFDFVFIDADHTYEGVHRDITAAFRRVRHGGMILGHDYNPKDFPGVVRAVDEHFGADALKFADHVWGAWI